MASFEALTLYLYDQADPTKAVHFDVSAMTPSTLGLCTFPAISGLNCTFAFLGLSQLWTDAQTFADGATGDTVVIIQLTDPAGQDIALRIMDVANAGSLELKVPAAGLLGARTQTFQDASGTLALLEVSQVWTGDQVFGISSGGGGTIGFYNGTYTVTLSGDFVSADGTIYLPDTGSRGGRLIVGIPGGAEKNLTGQTADIATANIITGLPAQMYRLSYVLADTASDLTAGAVTLTLGWTDDVGATTATATQVLTGTGRSSGSVVIYLASGNITYAVGHTGIFGTAQYALRLRVEAIG